MSFSLAVLKQIMASCKW